MVEALLCRHALGRPTTPRPPTCLESPRPTRVQQLGDFGIVKLLDGSITSAQTAVGTPYYLSPEVCQGHKYSYKSDVWALGCILYELCALQQAWNGTNLLGIVYKIVQEKQPPLPERYSTELKQLVVQMLSKAPDARSSLPEIFRLQ